ncbi:MAG: hypothetical protein RLZ92_948 [Pseudomonadota bacterium]|jgi:hypothetical protein
MAHLQSIGESKRHVLLKVLANNYRFTIFFFGSLIPLLALISLVTDSLNPTIVSFLKTIHKPINLLSTNRQYSTLYPTSRN